jgi:uncharacterized pyridoxamine 5'-phosphate oxidase family protein
MQNAKAVINTMKRSPSLIVSVVPLEKIYLSFMIQCHVQNNPPLFLNMNRLESIPHRLKNLFNIISDLLLFKKHAQEFRR